MADKLIRVNEKISVMASYVASVYIASGYCFVSTVDGKHHEVSFMGDCYRTKDSFEKSVNDALNDVKPGGATS
ncbi:hypothetical protein TUM17576_40170 [Enterobacter hormaechei]|nr:hypothetical protein [Enterobacter hormaechei]GJL37197.1 hypothetical protein TUM17576_40170 [Enterobacter hormaechei]